MVTAANAANLAPWAQARMIQTMISSFNGDGMPYPGPNAVLVRAYREKTIRFENWTMLTTVLRLWAGAMRVPFAPVRSVLGSTMEKENVRTFARLKNPFGPGVVGLAEAVQPDLSFIHGAVGDETGRVILPVPYGVSVYGALAAREGVIATVEKIIPARDMEAYKHWIVLPPEVVLAVCEYPLGAHPSALAAPGIRQIRGYGEDPPFVLEARKACRDAGQHQAWIKRWILQTRSPRDYARKLGATRIARLRRRLDPESWRRESAHALRRPVPAEITPQERMILGAADMMTELAARNGHRMVLAGVGAAHLAAYVAHRSADPPPFNVMVEIGTYGFRPVEGDSFVFHSRNFATASINTDILTTLGVCLPHPALKSLGVLGAAQIDRHGNLNSSLVTGDRPFFLGSGGANDVASLSSSVAVVIEQTPDKFVRRVPYVTCRGDKVVTAITQFGVLEKRGNELVLTRVFSGIDPEKAQASCGWPLKISPRLKQIPSPSRRALRLLRRFDPERYFLGR